ncbi:MAG: ATP synthase F1 subunit delta [Candidatus Calescibacterium sp.]|nr:ATP synthase F1 subunit delta [Candidatus Calescibacterium sp.]MDW8132400.1 ATP synthase F1 subunit delta [Candidatus Calescibacterium sp.]
MLSISARYANSLFQKAKEENQIDKVLEDLKNFLVLLEKNKQLLELWNSLSISSTDKEEIIIKRVDFSNITKNFLKLLLYKKRQKLLPKIYYYYKSLYNKHNNIIEVEISIAFEIDKTELEKLIRIIEENLGLKIKIKNIKIDPEIIGGAMIISDNIILDLSIKKDLDRLLRNFEETVNNKLSGLKMI